MAAIAPDAERELLAVLQNRAERNAAERDAALDALAAVVRLFDGKAFAPPEHQSAIWNAKAVLAQHGRKVR